MDEFIVKTYRKTDIYLTCNLTGGGMSTGLVILSAAVKSLILANNFENGCQAGVDFTILTEQLTLTTESSLPRLPNAGMGMDLPLEYRSNKLHR